MMPIIGNAIPFIRFSGQFRRFNGFTLTELMVTLVVAGILIMVGVPSFRNIIQNARLSTQANDLLTDIAYARSEAIKRGQPVTLCRRSAPPSATCNTAAGTSWTNGWVIFLDTNGNGQVDTTAPAEEVLRLHASIEGGNTVTAEILGTASGTASPDGSTAIDPLLRIVFKPSGLTSINTTVSAGYRVCDQRPSPLLPKNYAKTVALNAIGQARINPPPATACP